MTFLTLAKVALVGGRSFEESGEVAAYLGVEGDVDEEADEGVEHEEEVDGVHGGGVEGGRAPLTCTTHLHSKCEDWMSSTYSHESYQNIRCQSLALWGQGQWA